MTGKKQFFTIISFLFSLSPSLSLIFLPLILCSSESSCLGSFMPFFALGFFWLCFHPIHLPETSIHQTPKSSFLLLPVDSFFFIFLCSWRYCRTRLVLYESIISGLFLLHLPTKNLMFNAINETSCDYTDSKWVPQQVGTYIQLLNLYYNQGSSKLHRS